MALYLLSNILKGGYMSILRDTINERASWSMKKRQTNKYIRYLMLIPIIACLYLVKHGIIQF